MRFSVLTLNLHTWQESDQLEKFDRIAQYLVEQNITTVCFQECGQRHDADVVEDSTAISLTDGRPVRTDNAAKIVQSRLESYGLKYGMVWDFSHTSFGDYEEGSAILTQLPMLGACSRYVSSETEPGSIHARNVVMSRLAVAPNAVIDVYSVHLSWPDSGLEDQLESLVGFVDQTPEILEQMKPPPPKRRGPPRKRRAEVEPVVSTRLVCLAGDFNETPDGAIGMLTTRGYLDATKTIRGRDPQAATFADDGRWIDYIYIKPALKPQDARLVFAGTDAAPVSDHFALAVEFEV